MENLFKNILIVRTDKIGDVVLTTPAIEALRRAYPPARISIIVSPLTKDIVENNPFIDEVLIDDKKGLHKGPLGFLKLVAELKNKKFDCAFVFHTKKRTNAFCFLAGIPRRIGYRNNKFGSLLTDQFDDMRRWGEKHEQEYCLDVLRQLNIEIKEKNILFALTDEAVKWADNTLLVNNLADGRKIVAIHAGASDHSRCWPTNQFAELIESIYKRYNAHFITIGAKDVAEKSKEIQALVHVPVVDFSGKISVGQCAALLKRCNILISNDSGPVHIGSAVNIPVVDIFVRNHPGVNPIRWRPLSENSRVVAPKIQTLEPQFIDNSLVLEAVDSIFKLC